MNLGIDNEYGTIGKDAIDQVDKLLLNNRLLQLFVATLFIVLLILTFGYFSLSSERTSHISMPPYGEFEVAKMRADPMYYRVWGDFVLTRFANFNPSTIKDNLLKSSEIFERNTYLTKKADFDKYYAAVMTNNITQDFRYDENEVNIELKNGGSVATVTYDGYATQSISNITKITKKCRYQFGFYISDYKIYQDSVFTDCLNNNSVHQLTDEEKVIENNDPTALIREAQKTKTDSDIDKKMIKRENLDSSVKERSEFEQERIKKRQEKIIDENYILSGIREQNSKQTEHLNEDSNNDMLQKQNIENNKSNAEQNTQGENNTATKTE